MSIKRLSTRAHPLYNVIGFHARNAWRRVRHSTVVLPEIRHPAVLGHIYEYHLAKELRLSSDWKLCSNHVHEKDLVHMPDDAFSIEVKTTSRWRDDSVRGSGPYTRSKKQRDGYYLVVGYELEHMRLMRVRFGWISDADFATGKRVRSAVARSRMITLFAAPKPRN